jgi:hypothetical protein
MTASARPPCRVVQSQSISYQRYCTADIEESISGCHLMQPIPIYQDPLSPSATRPLVCTQTFPQIGYLDELMSLGYDLLELGGVEPIFVKVFGGLRHL